MKNYSGILKMAGALVLLAAVAFFLLRRPGEQSRSADEQTPFAAVDSAAVDRIVVKTSPGSIVVERRGSEWMLQEPLEYRASRTAVTSALNKLRTAMIRSTVSSNPEKQRLFQVDSTGVEVHVFEHGAEKLVFVVGKNSSDFTGTFVRRQNSNDVLLVNGLLGSVFSRNARDWRDKKIPTAPREAIQSVQFQYGRERFVLQYKDSLWTVDGRGADENIVTTLVQSLAALEADDFIEPAPQPFPKIDAVLSFGGAELRFSLRKETSQYLIQSSASPQWFAVSSYRIEQLLKKKADLLKK